MTGWQPIDTAPRETGRPLLLYPYPYVRKGRATEAAHPGYRVLFDVNDATVRRIIQLAKRRGYVTSDVLNELMPPEIFSPEQIKQVLDQLAQAGINVVGEIGAKKTDEDDQPGASAEREGTQTLDLTYLPDAWLKKPDGPKAPVIPVGLPEEPPVIYSKVFEGYWDDTQWRSAGDVPCEPTHWMPLPAPPLTLVSR